VFAGAGWRAGAGCCLGQRYSTTICRAWPGFAVVGADRPEAAPVLWSRGAVRTGPPQFAKAVMLLVGGWGGPPGGRGECGSAVAGLRLLGVPWSGTP
jgi:hypothetical protein